MKIIDYFVFLEQCAVKKRVKVRSKQINVEKCGTRMRDGHWYQRVNEEHARIVEKSVQENFRRQNAEKLGQHFRFQRKHLQNADQCAEEAEKSQILDRRALLYQILGAHVAYGVEDGAEQTEQVADELVLEKAVLVGEIVAGHNASAADEAKSHTEHMIAPVSGLQQNVGEQKCARHNKGVNYLYCGDNGQRVGFDNEKVGLNVNYGQKKVDEPF